MSQTVQPFEVIVIDDASSDSSIDSIKRKAVGNFRYISRVVPGPGGYAARNAGIRIATAEWIAFLDADDAWLPNHLATLSEMIQQADANTSVVFTGYEIEEDPVNTEVTMGESGPRCLKGIDVLEHWAAQGSPLWTGALAARKDALLNCGLFPEGRCERGGDKDLWLRLIVGANLVNTSAKTAIYHRNSSNMVTRSVSHAVPHCINETIVGMISNADKRTAKALAGIFLRENRKYVKAAAVDGQMPRMEMPIGLLKILPLQSALAVLNFSGALAYSFLRRHITTRIFK